MTVADVQPEVSQSLADFRAGKIGVYPGIPAEEYHKLRAISSTTLKKLHCESPKHAKAVLDNPDLVTSDEMDIGGAAHAILLTETEFDETYICSTTCSAIVKASGKPCSHGGQIFNDGKWYCGVHGKGLEQQSTATVLTPEEFIRVEGIRDEVWNNPDASELLMQATDFELSVLWVETAPDGTALLNKARFDILCSGIGVLPDLKTCRSCKPDRFESQAWDLGYHLQLAHYLRGAQVSESGADLPTIIAVESKPPFDSVVFSPTSRFIEQGITARNNAIASLLECERSGIWPGHAKGPQKLDIPKWKR